MKGKRINDQIKVYETMKRLTSKLIMAHVDCWLHVDSVLQMIYSLLSLSLLSLLQMFLWFNELSILWGVFIVFLKTFLGFVLPLSADRGCFYGGGSQLFNFHYKIQHNIGETKTMREVTYSYHISFRWSYT